MSQKEKKDKNKKTKNLQKIEEYIISNSGVEINLDKIDQQNDENDISNESNKKNLSNKQNNLDYNFNSNSIINNSQENYKKQVDTQRKQGVQSEFMEMKNSTAKTVQEEFMVQFYEVKELMKNDCKFRIKNIAYHIFQNEQVTLMITKVPINNIQSDQKNQEQHNLDIGHELRTPLNCIINMLEEALNDQEGFFENNFNQVLTSSKLLSNLVHDLLDMSQQRAGKFKLVYNVFDFYQLIYNVKNLLTILTEQKNLYFEVEILENVENFVKSDQFRIRQILINLVSNAVKFTDNGGVKLIISNAGQKQIKISVQDTGSGIKDKQKLFKAFNKDDDDSKNPQGVGLGLMISNKLAKELNNQKQGLIVENDYNQGTTFSFIIDNLVDSADIIQKSQMSNSFQNGTIYDEKQDQSAMSNFLTANQTMHQSINSNRKKSTLIGKNQLNNLNLDLALPALQNKYIQSNNSINSIVNIDQNNTNNKNQLVSGNNNPLNRVSFQQQLQNPNQFNSNKLRNIGYISEKSLKVLQEDFSENLNQSINDNNIIQINSINPKLKTCQLETFFEDKSNSNDKNDKEKTFQLEINQNQPLKKSQNDEFKILIQKQIYEKPNIIQNHSLINNISSQNNECDCTQILNKLSIQNAVQDGMENFLEFQTQKNQQQINQNKNEAPLQNQQTKKLNQNKLDHLSEFSANNNRAYKINYLSTSKSLGNYCQYNIQEKNQTQRMQNQKGIKYDYNQNKTRFQTIDMQQKNKIQLNFQNQSNQAGPIEYLSKINQPGLSLNINLNHCDSKENSQIKRKHEAQNEQQQINNKLNMGSKLDVTNNLLEHEQKQHKNIQKNNENQVFQNKQKDKNSDQIQSLAQSYSGEFLSLNDEEIDKIEEQQYEKDQENEDQNKTSINQSNSQKNQEQYNNKVISKTYYEQSPQSQISYFKRDYKQKCQTYVNQRENIDDQSQQSIYGQNLFNKFHFQNFFNEEKSKFQVKMYMNQNSRYQGQQYQSQASQFNLGNKNSSSKVQNQQNWQKQHSPKASNKSGDKFNKKNNFLRTKSSFAYIKDENKYKIVEVTLIPIIYKNQSCILFFIQDVTKIQSLQALITLNENKNMHYNYVVHELRNPLNVISSGLQTAKSDPEEFLKSQLQLLISQTQILTNRVNDLLDESQQKAGIFNIAIREFNFYEFLVNIKDTMRTITDIKGLDLYLNVDQNVPQFVNSDFNRLTQIMMNIIGNCIKFTDQGSIGIIVSCIQQQKIDSQQGLQLKLTEKQKNNKKVYSTLEVEDDDQQQNEIIQQEYIQFTIKDTGVGISQENQKKLFKAFAKIKDDDRNPQGVGLGLEISNRLVYQLSGNKKGIQVQSSGINGEGSQFVFQIKNYQNLRNHDSEEYQHQTTQFSQFTSDDYHNHLKQKLFQYGHIKQLADEQLSTSQKNQNYSYNQNQNNMKVKNDPKQNKEYKQNQSNRMIEKDEFNFEDLDDRSFDECRENKENNQDYNQIHDSRQFHIAHISNINNNLGLENNSNSINNLALNNNNMSSILNNDGHISREYLLQSKQNAYDLDDIQLQMDVKKNNICSNFTTKRDNSSDRILIQFNDKENGQKKCQCNQILVVDDEPLNIISFKSIIRSYYQKIDSAFSGEQAISRVREKQQNNCCQKYKIIFMDMNMGNLSGLDTIKQILQLEKQQKFILLSGNSCDDKNLNLKSYGIEYWWEKPVQKNLLQEYIKQNIL
ncbi:Signal transduction histidine kinase, homodimeric domain [Pseudocohnilembus persalinus]|uniref:histidine kinase n=1 Tax=Pseudocohnilembus persalinus TaxID=266149 RepID=A0A0V0Q9V5_PSEPJ|nr:Signal transduction histidine kinase, homodimeric domain [Pseudocohnilembus persalinus]|eukprot:KRW99000.1 Signal transduction histidine kinase, homodimeric domain [Pseudocohnilembus persalinus]